jgi:hypothetical protein
MMAKGLVESQAPLSVWVLLPSARDASVLEWWRGETDGAFADNSGEPTYCVLANGRWHERHSVFVLPLKATPEERSKRREHALHFMEKGEKLVRYYPLILVDLLSTKRRSRCAGCGAPILGKRLCRKAFFSHAYYTREKRYCLYCKIPAQLFE